MLPPNRPAVWYPLDMNSAGDMTSKRLELGGRPSARRTAAEFLADFDVTKAPTAPGCYVMQDAKGKVIYVGKAKNIQARLRNYLNQSDSRYSVKFLMRRVRRIDFLVTRNEKEALLLENSLIKQYKPRYNIRLKDDKTYISLRLDTREDFPRVTVVRRHKKDGARYFGPYHSAGAVRATLRMTQRLFPLRTCSDHVMHNRTRPCLYHQMNQCVAPCVGLATRDAYHEIAEQVILTLEGRSDELMKRLHARIREHAEKLEFEEAAILRDRLHDLQRTLERQRTVAVPGAEDCDVFGLYGEGAFTEIQILFYRGGKMLGGRAFSFQHREMPADELLSSFLTQYYAEAPVVPGGILLPMDLEDTKTLSEVLSEQRGAQVKLERPQRGEKRALLDLARRNARSSFHEKRLAERANEELLEQTRHALKLLKPPQRIECFDISTIQGAKTVASMVAFVSGQPDTSRYRRFSIRGVEGQDDFASMREVLLRRYEKAVKENDLPDLVLIDGGKGHLNVATAVFKDLGIEDLPHAGIAKARAHGAAGPSPERFFLPGRANPVVLRQSSPVVQFLARVRNEAHRFAITYHRKKRGKATLRTQLTAIPGIGPRRAQTLLNKLGSLARIGAATVEDIAVLPGFSKELARVVHNHLDRALEHHFPGTAGRGDVQENTLGDMQ